MPEKQKDPKKQTKITTASVLKLKQRLRVFVWSVFIFSALAVVGASALPKITQPVALEKIQFVTGETRYAATSTDYQTTNTPLLIDDMILADGAEKIPLFNAARIAGDGEIGHIYSPVYDLAAYEDPTGLYKTAFGQRRVSPGNNYVAFLLRGAPEAFTADAGLEWHKLETTSEGNSFVIFDELPTNVTANWKYVQLGIELRRNTSTPSPQVGNMVMQTVSFVGAPEGQCANGVIPPLSGCTCGTNFVTDEPLVPTEGFCYNNQWQIIDPAVIAQIPNYTPHPVTEFIHDNANFFYVAPWGNDATCDLTENNPCSDIRRADEVREFQPGDVLLLRGGTYYRENDYYQYETSPHRITEAGIDPPETPEADPIYIVMTASPGEIPIYHRGFGSSIQYQTITLYGEYQVLDSVKIVGNASVRNGRSFLQNNEIIGGSGSSNDRNPSMTWLYRRPNIYTVIRNNYYHDADFLGDYGVNYPARMAAIRAFQSDYLKIKNNAFIRIGNNNGIRFPVIYMKDASSYWQVESNLFKDFSADNCVDPTCHQVIAISGQAGIFNEIGAQDIQIHNNKIVNVESVYYALNMENQQVNFYNNEVKEAKVFIAYNNGLTHFSNIPFGEVYNNIIEADVVWHETEDYETEVRPGNDNAMPDFWDYNCYTPETDRTSLYEHSGGAVYDEHSITSNDCATAGQGAGHEGADIGVLEE